MSAPDINMLDLSQEFLEVSDAANQNPEDFYRPSLPDDGEWLAVATLGTDGVKHAFQKDKKTGQEDRTKPYLMAQVALKLQDSGLVVFDRPTTIVFQSKGTSALHALMAVLGQPLQGRMNFAEIKSAVETAFAQSPLVRVTTQWEAQLEVSPKKYETVKRGQVNFPKVLDQNGQEVTDPLTGKPKYSPDVEDPKTGKIATAQAKVIRYARA